MFSLVKFALFSLISFATLALAIPSPAGQPNDPRALIAKANDALQGTVLPLSPFYLPFYTSLNFFSPLLIRLC
jgi:hypothetical protein